jgi:2,3-bisphosphoglycerate-independent phosphoglycerate mutase
VKAGFSGRRNAYLGLTVILEPPYKGQFEAVSMDMNIVPADVTMRGSYTTARVALARGHP